MSTSSIPTEPVRSSATSWRAPARQLARPPVVTVTGAGVRVELALEADYIFADVIPGAPDGTVVAASATATAVPAP